MDAQATEGGRGKRLLGARHAHRIVVLVALGLTAPSLAGGLVLDDHVLALLARPDNPVAGLQSDPLALFRFTTGQRATNRALMDEGVLLPWWADPHHRNAFFRPISSLTHVLDFALWPNTPWLMHLHSLVWLAALLGVLAHVYRRVASGPAWVATLALLLYAVDDARGMTVGWIANRNALVAATLALPALSAHHRWVANGWQPGRWIAPACFGLGLAAGETAVAVLGYLIAYVLVLDRRTWPQRLGALAPYLVLMLAFGVVFSLQGLGSHGSGLYHDPMREPVAYAMALVSNLPVLLGAQLGVQIADLATIGNAQLAAAAWVVGAGTLVAIAWLGVRLLRHDREALFWAVGMVLAGCAVAASVPGDRLLTVVGVGGAGLLARLFYALTDAVRSGQTRWRAALVVLVALHLVIAPLALPARAMQMGVYRRALDRAERSLPSDAAIADATVIILDAPFDMMASYIQAARAARDAPRPAHLQWLATASSTITVRGIDDHTLDVDVERGWMQTPLERHYRGDVRSLPRDARVELTAFTATIRAVTEDGRPRSVRFRFHEPLKSPRYRWMRWDDGRYSSTQPPAPGQKVRFPARELTPTVLQSAFHD